jgi:ubiquinone/menaquinone biosynthesis C-methylase UbiE
MNDWTRVERHWRRRRAVPALYDVAVEHERLARLGGRLLWGADVRDLYRDFGGFARLPAGAAVLDVPCGGGVAFRGVPRDAGLRYAAVDLSPLMLARARAEARRRGLDVALTRAGVERLPYADGAFDLCVTFNGLHCLPDPASAVAELARVLRPGGLLRGSVVVTGAGRRQDALIALLRALGDFGAPVTLAGLRDLLDDAGFAAAEVTTSGALVRFTAVKPG